MGGWVGCLVGVESGGLKIDVTERLMRIGAILRQGIGRMGGLAAPAADREGPTFLPGIGYGREVLAVCYPGDEEAEQGAGEDIERVVAGVHDARIGDEGGAEGGNEDEKGLPYFAALVEDVQFGGEIEREVEKTGEGGAGMTGGEAAETVLPQRMTGGIANGEVRETEHQRVLCTVLGATAIDEIRAWLSRGVLEGTGDGDSGGDR